MQRIVLSMMVGLVLVIALGACGSAATPAPASGGALAITDFWARPTSMGSAAMGENMAGKVTGATYMTLAGGSAGDKLLRGETDVAQVVELHTTAMENNVMRMRPVQSIEVPVNGTVQLKPGGLHVMLIGVKKELKPGDTFKLKLTFEKAGVKELDVPVREMPAMNSGSSNPAPMGLTIKDVWARASALAPMGGMDMKTPASGGMDMGTPAAGGMGGMDMNKPTSAVYMKIDGGGMKDKLVKAESAVAENVELHTVEMKDGVMQMRPVEGGIEVPAEGGVELKPGGFHVMLIGLKQELKPGEKFNVKLTFERAGVKEVTAEIRSLQQ